jgi:signal transduction histidine kinase/DNA-binding response OmpR family regulator
MRLATPAPIADSAAPDPNVAAADVGCANDQTPINILIVDDEPKNLTVLETVLDHPGYRLVRAESADEALLALVSKEFALLILDIRMPGMSGLELAQMVKARKRTARIPIIFLTAYYGEDENVLEGYDIGAVDYLQKPVNPTVLRSKVEVFADLHRHEYALALANSALRAEVSERRHAEERVLELNRTLEERVRERTIALHASDARLRLATEAAQIGIWSWQPDLDQLVWENDWPHKAFGVAPVTGPMSVSGCVATKIHPDDHDAFVEIVRAGTERRGRIVFEGRLLLGDGDEHWVEIIGQPMLTSGEGAAPLFGTARDVTKRKQAEQSQRDADARKDAFLATLAHELRNPLAPIRAAASILESPGVPAEKLGACRAIIARQVRHMAALLDDLLDISRVSRGKLELKRGSVDLGSALEEAIESAQPLIAAKRHQLKYSPLDPPITITADRVRLIQIVTNLLTNAAKYTDEGGEIDLEASLAEDGLRLRICDNGIGMSATTLPRVFDMFTQGAGSERRAEGGLGIGLALARGLVELHGGRLDAYSAGLAQGSQFTIWLPVTAAFPDTTAARASRPGPPIAPSRPRRILIADDNRDAATTLAHFLSLSGHEVVTANSGPEALAEILRGRPEALVLDIGLPGMTGYEIAKRVRQEPWGPKALLIAVTGFGQDRDRRQALAAGFDHHLTKPIEPVALENILAMDRM